MAKTDFKSVDEYIAAQPTAVHAVLERVRSTIQKALPAAQEAISYQIPAYKQHGEAVLFFAGWKKHFSVYPANAALVAALADELSHYAISKGTIRFPLSEPAPLKLIARIAKLRAKQARERQKAKAAAR